MQTGQAARAPTMGIADKTRKVLWGRSGNLCAFCKAHLVVDASALDPESVVGDECHIVSGAANGPRHDPEFASELVDNPENLILLCRVHHKLVDDQAETFTASALRELKANHESWVKSKLRQPNQLEPIRYVRFQSEIPSHLILVSSAKTLLDLAANCHGRYDNYPDDLLEAELECVGALLQNLTDWVDLGLNEPYERISAQKALAEDLSDLAQAGLRLYAGRERQELRGGVMPPSSIYMLHVQIVRSDDPRQMTADGLPGAN